MTRPVAQSWGNTPQMYAFSDECVLGTCWWLTSHPHLTIAVLLTPVGNIAFHNSRSSYMLDFQIKQWSKVWRLLTWHYQSPLAWCFTTGWVNAAVAPRADSSGGSWAWGEATSTTLPLLMAQGILLLRSWLVLTHLGKLYLYLGSVGRFYEGGGVVFLKMGQCYH